MPNLNWYWWIVIIILAAAGGLFVLYLFLRSKNKEQTESAEVVKEDDKKTDKKANEGGLKNIGATVFYVVLVLAAINLLISVSDSSWNNWWGNQRTFWACNLAFGLALFLVLSKVDDKQTEGPKVTKAGYAILILSMFAMVGMVFYPLAKKGLGSLWTKPATAITPVTSTPDMNTALFIIAGCESGNRHFDESGAVIRNTNGTEDPSDDDIGRYQINLKHQADIIKKSGLDVYDETGNRRIAELVITEKGIDQWNPSKDCWGPKLAALTNGERKFEATVTAPPKGETDRWSDKVRIPSLTAFSVVPKTTERRRYFIKANENKIVEYDTSIDGKCFDDSGKIADKGACLPMPTLVVEFQSADDKPLEMVVKFFPYQGN